MDDVRPPPRRQVAPAVRTAAAFGVAMAVVPSARFERSIAGGDVFPSAEPESTLVASIMDEWQCDGLTLEAVSAVGLGLHGDSAAVIEFARFPRVRSVLARPQGGT
jgi:hypothetical protein